MTRASIATVAACASLLGGVAVHAQESGTVCQLRVGAIVASDAGRPDKELVGLQKQWEKLFHYSSYKVVKEETRSVKWKTRTGFDIPGGRYLVVSPRGMRGEKILLKILLLKGSRPLVDTVLALNNEGAVVVGGQKHDEGVLLLSIGARTETHGPWKTSSLMFGEN